MSPYRLQGVLGAKGLASQAGDGCRPGTKAGSLLLEGLGGSVQAQVPALKGDPSRLRFHPLCSQHCFPSRPPSPVSLPIPRPLSKRRCVGVEKGECLGISVFDIFQPDPIL